MLPNEWAKGKFKRTHFRNCVSMQRLVLWFPFKFLHCYCTSCFHLYADLWLPGDRCVWNKHLSGGTEVAPWQWVPGGDSDQRVYASTHGFAWRNGGEAWACMSAGRQSDRLRESHTTGSWLRWMLLCLQNSISFKSWVEGPSQANHMLLTYTSAVLFACPALNTS